MGAYLSTPRTEKDSTDEKADDMHCGASSMQGWRINQEDAHNCELNFDKDTSFFAVYDGHGGPEIALYCSKYLPEFLKSTEAYAKGDYEEALRQAFLGFDSKLLGADVIEELKELAGDKYGYGEDDHEDEDSDEDLAELKQEGGMPLDDVLNKYKNMIKSHLKVKDEDEAGGSSSSKPHSPFLRGKKPLNSQEAVVEENGSEKTKVEKPSGSKAAADEAVSSSSVAEKEEPASSTAAATASTESPDSSSTTKTKVENNSDDGAAAASSKVANDVSSSNAAVNGSGESKEASGSSSSASNSISSTNADRAAKRIAMSLPNISPDADSDEESDEDERDVTYNENADGDDLLDDDMDDDEDEEDDDDDEDDEEEEDEDDEDAEDVDGFISNMVEEPGKDSGCTAVVALRHGRTLYVANAGDSRCVLSRSGEVVEMSFDHKPEDDVEHSRITKAGGRVTLDGRVNGGLNLSRAIGDHAYKMNKTLSPAEQMISALPDIKKIELTDADDFMVLACDGIWNFMSSEAVVQFVRTRLDKAEKLSKICEELFDHCLAKDTSGDGTGCDNMTAIVVRFAWPSKDVGNSEAAPVLEVGLKRAASSSPLPVPEISEAEPDGGLKAKRAKTDVEEAQAPTTTSV